MEHSLFSAKTLNAIGLMGAFFASVLLYGCASPPSAGPAAAPPKAAENNALRNLRNEQKTLVFAPANSVSAPSGTIDLALKSRVEARWNALISGDLELAYKLMSANSRKIYSLADFRQDTKPGRWKRVTVVGAKCEEKELCLVTVGVVVGYRVKNAGEIDTEVLRSEDWIFSEGDWYFVRKIEL
jgi:hypothetical protein